MNAMSDEDTRSFKCPPNAIGTSLKIKLKTKYWMMLELCEVQILGKGIAMYVMVLRIRIHLFQVKTHIQ